MHELKRTMEAFIGKLWVGNFIGINYFKFKFLT